ncbi:MAG: gliding motility-associated C-terminal domain-containing protein, partial [Opitutaceae bacterium]|nr:gliding motility-associated C-terminal domain-containing protein [Cytophagales bacterium]
MPFNGEISMTYKGDLTYKPKEDFVGKDTAIFYVCDYTSSREYCTIDPFYCRKDTVVFDVKPYRIFIPDGFSPNNDGTNDLFVIRSEVPLNVDIKLYNRWGNLVYEKDGYQNDFDGRANRGIVIGDGLPDGTYYLHYNVNDKLIDPNP